MIDSGEWGPLQLDSAYGGAFYAILPADSIGLDLLDTPARHFAEAGAAISEATRAQVALAHPDGADTAFLHDPLYHDGSDPHAADTTRHPSAVTGRLLGPRPAGPGLLVVLATDRSTAVTDNMLSARYPPVVPCPF